MYGDFFHALDDDRTLFGRVVVQSEFGRVVCGRKQVVDVFVVDFDEGDSHGALHFLDAEFVKQVGQRSGNYSRKWVLDNDKVANEC